MGFSSSHAWRRCVLLAVVLTVSWGWQRAEAFGPFGFDMHHRYSDPVGGILDLHELPKKGSPGYYSAMAYRDLVHRGRHLADTTNSPSLTFDGGNETHRLSSLGFLHYANVSVGTPSLSFLVALDTGSDLFWLPCDCISCVHGLKGRSGKEIEFNIYSPNTSSTSMTVPCNSTMCGKRQRQCSVKRNACAYQMVYLSNGTSSTGILVDDILHLATVDSQPKDVDARITFGCGMIQTGSFLDGAAPNGLFGLGMDNVSVPSILANQGLIANSFSMCFGANGTGRINFGDKGSSDQGETPFHLDQRHPTYNVSLRQIVVGDNATNLDITAIFDSGTSFSYLNDPAYAIMSQNFNALVKEKRRKSDASTPFEFCYDLSANQESFEVPNVTLTMESGDRLSITDPIVIISDGKTFYYCLAVVRSGDINIIGQNFMTGYSMVFDREKMVLGWKASECNEGKDSNTLPVNPRNQTAAPPPTTIVDPEATSGNRTGSPSSSSNSSLPSPPTPPPPSTNHSPLSCTTCTTTTTTLLLTFLVLVVLAFI